MNISEQEQDIILRDSSRQKSDSIVQKQGLQTDSTRIRDSLPIKKREIRLVVETPGIKDTVSVSERSHVADVTFYDSANIITRINSRQINRFPYIFLEKNRNRETETKAQVMRQLKDGDVLTVRPFHDDWIIFIILIASFLYASIQTFSRKLFPGVIRFFLFRGIGDPAARETSELFHWQSTIINLITFFNLSLFAYYVAVYYGTIPHPLPEIISWLIVLGIVIVIITLRHIVCIITGRLSDQKEIFDEYIITIYQSFRYQALICFILVILLSYTAIFPAKTLLITGYISFAVLYLMRITRLFLIFIKRNVSVLYLILYLCALEFLPVVVLSKYIAGLF